MLGSTLCGASTRPSADVSHSVVALALEHFGKFSKDFRRFRRGKIVGSHSIPKVLDNLPPSFVRIGDVFLYPRATQGKVIQNIWRNRLVEIQGVQRIHPNLHDLSGRFPWSARLGIPGGNSRLVGQIQAESEQVFRVPVEVGVEARYVGDVGLGSVEPLGLLDGPLRTPRLRGGRGQLGGSLSPPRPIVSRASLPAGGRGGGAGLLDVVQHPLRHFGVVCTLPTVAHELCLKLPQDVWIRVGRHLLHDNLHLHAIFGAVWAKLQQAVEDALAV